MATRYIWEKFNTTKEYYWTDSNVAANYGFNGALKSETTYINYSTSITENSTSISLNSPQQIVITGSDIGKTFTFPAGTYFIVSKTNVTKSSTYYKTTASTTFTTTLSGTSQIRFNNSASLKLYTLTSKVVKGSTSYGYVKSTNKSAYPTNNYSGSYWYVYVGTENINFVGYEGTVKDVKTVVCVDGVVKTNVKEYQGVNGVVKQS